MNNYSSQNFADDLHSASWENIDTSLTVSNAWMDIADKRAPFMTMRIRSSTLPWLNEDIRNLIKERNFNHKKAQKSGSCNDWATCSAIRNQVVSQIRDAKRNYYTNLIEENITNFPDSTTPSLLENKNFVIVSDGVQTGSYNYY